MIKCDCNDPNCKMKISFENNKPNKPILNFTDKDGDDNFFYLDPVTIAILVNELREVYLWFLEDGITLRS